MAAIMLIPAMANQNAYAGGEEPEPAVQKHRYEFSGNFDDSLSGPSLTNPSGEGILTATTYVFDKGDGLKLESPLVSNDNYSIEMCLKVGPGLDQKFPGWRKLIDFKDLVPDPGLYVTGPNFTPPPDKLWFSNDAFGTTSVTADEFLHVVLTRDGNTDDVIVYFDGNEEFGFTDDENRAVFDKNNNVLHFLKDDVPGDAPDDDTSNGEDPDGTIDYIKIYEGVLGSDEVASNASSCPAEEEPELFSLNGDDFDQPIVLHRVNPFTAQTISSVEVTIDGISLETATGLATNPFTGELWGLVGIEENDVQQCGRELIIIDQLTGVATRIGDTGLKLAAIAFDDTGKLYALAGENDVQCDTGLPPRTLVTLNQETASPTQVCRFFDEDTRDGEALAFNFDDGNLYRNTGRSSGHFDRVDGFPADSNDACVVTEIQTNSPEHQKVRAITYWDAQNLFLWTDAFDLWTSTLDGVFSFVEHMDHDSKGLAFTFLELLPPPELEPEPEPITEIQCSYEDEKRIVINGVLEYSVNGTCDIHRGDDIETKNMTLDVEKELIPITDSIEFPDFSSIDGLTLNGDAEQVTDILRLVPSVGSQSGTSYSNDKVSISEFSTQFQIEFSDSNGFADGLTFVIQNDPDGVNAIGGGGGGLAYSNLTPSVAVSFDIWVNGGCESARNISILSDGETCSP